MKLMSKISKISAWILAVCFLLYVFTGLDIQARIFWPQLSSLIHLKYLFILALVAFMLHTSYSIYSAIKGWKFWRTLGKIFLGLYIAVNFALIYLYIIVQF